MRIIAFVTVFLALASNLIADDETVPFSSEGTGSQEFSFDLVVPDIDSERIADSQLIGSWLMTTIFDLETVTHSLSSGSLSQFIGVSLSKGIDEAATLIFDHEERGVTYDCADCDVEYENGHPFVWRVRGRNRLHLAYYNFREIYLLHIVDSDTIAFYAEDPEHEDLTWFGLFRRVKGGHPDSAEPN